MYNSKIRAFRFVQKSLKGPLSFDVNLGTNPFFLKRRFYTLAFMIS